MKYRKYLLIILVVFIIVWIFHKLIINWLISWYIYFFYPPIHKDFFNKHIEEYEVLMSSLSEHEDWCYTVKLDQNWCYWVDNLDSIFKKLKINTVLIKEKYVSVNLDYRYSWKWKLNWESMFYFVSWYDWKLPYWVLLEKISDNWVVYYY